MFEQARKSRCAQSHRAKADVRIKAEVTQCNGQNYENPRLGDNYRGLESLLEPRALKDGRGGGNPIESIFVVLM